MKEGIESFVAINPFNNTELSMEFHEPTGEELKEAITKAKEAFPAFGKSGKEKANFIDSIADGILNSGIF